MATKTVKRWVVLDPEVDDFIIKEAEQEGRSISNKLRYIINQYYAKSSNKSR